MFVLYVFQGLVTGFDLGFHFFFSVECTNEADKDEPSGGLVKPPSGYSQTGWTVPWNAI